jgi:hypothetical protein
MKTLIVLCCLVCVSLPALDVRMENIEGANETPGERLRVIARRYLDRRSTPAEDTKWTKRFTDRVKQRAQDSGLEAEVCAWELFQDWAAGQRKYLEDPTSAPESVLIDCCRYVSWFTEHNYSLPPRLYRELTHKHLDMIDGALANL